MYHIMKLIEMKIKDTEETEDYDKDMINEKNAEQPISKKRKKKKCVN